jgi:predicted PurR-regulated permease PerM
VTRQRERAGAGVTQGLVAAAVAVAFCYWAEAVALPLVLAVLLAFLLDPLVDLVERAHLPRSVATVLVLLSVSAVLSSIGLLLWDQAREMADLWPRYAATLGRAVGEGLRRVDHYLRRLLPVGPSDGTGSITLVLAEERQLRDVLLRGVGSLYSVLWVVAFVPFLTFFMLSEKPALAEASLGLFPPWRRPEVRRAIDEVDRVLRRYILGNVLVVLILILASGLFFWLIGLQNPFLTAALCGPVNLVPYFGAILAWVPPSLVGLSQWSSPGPFVAVAVVLSLLHLVAINALLPVLVGRSVRINALSVTLALLFWGWLWGGIGLVVAIPMVAGLKVVCDHVEEWRPLGRWLGA